MAKGASSGGGDRHLPASAFSMALIRLFLGGFFLYTGIQKVLEMEKFQHFLQQATSASGLYVVDNMWPEYANILVNTVNTHIEVFAWLVLIGELLVGAMLVLGLLTRLAGLGGVAISTAYLLATMHTTAADFGMHAAFIAMGLAVVISAAGRTFGIDRAIAKRTRVKLLW